MHDIAPYKPIRKNTQSTSDGHVMTYDRKYPGVSFSTDQMTNEEIASMSGPVITYNIKDIKEAAQ